MVSQIHKKREPPIVLAESDTSARPVNLLRYDDGYLRLEIGTKTKRVGILETTDVWMARMLYTYLEFLIDADGTKWDDPEYYRHQCERAFNMLSVFIGDDVAVYEWLYNRAEDEASRISRLRTEMHKLKAKANYHYSFRGTD